MGSVTVISPHLDDAVFSIGGLIGALVRQGHRVRVVTVFAGDPEDPRGPLPWDAVRRDPSTGERIATAGGAIAQRHAEDAAAMDVLGVAPDDAIRLRQFTDSDIDTEVSHLGAEPQTDRPSVDDVRSRIWEAVRPHCVGSDVVLVPGFPLAHVCHEAVAEVMTSHAPHLPPLVYYKELPYGASPWELLREFRAQRSARIIGRGHQQLTWIGARLSPADLVTKRRAVSCYVGELLLIPLESRRARLAYKVFGREALGMADPAATPLHLFEPWSMTTPEVRLARLVERFHSRR